MITEFSNDIPWCEVPSLTQIKIRKVCLNLFKIGATDSMQSRVDKLYKTYVSSDTVIALVKKKKKVKNKTQLY